MFIPLWLAAGTARAQTARIEGTVVDTAGTAISGATVTAAGTRAVTDSAGRFRMVGAGTAAAS
jgi:hypothetical protein